MKYKKILCFIILTTLIVDKKLISRKYIIDQK